MDSPGEHPQSDDSVDLKPLFPNPWFTALTGQTAEQAPEPLVHIDEPNSPASFDPDENSAYFQFFRGIHNDYQELPAKKQRLFRRECLGFLHRLLDEEDGAGADEQQQQRDAMNLSSSAVDSDDERDSKLCVIESVAQDNYKILPH